MDEIVQKLEENKTEDVPLFMEDFQVKYDGTEKAFLGIAEGKERKFTLPAFYGFCNAIGIPAAFVDKIPNPLLDQNIQSLLDDNNQKIRIGTRGDVIAYTRHDSYVPIKSLEFIDSVRPILPKHLFREGSLHDDGMILELEPLVDISLTPSTTDPMDKFNVGTAFHVGFGSGLVRAMPYSLRHVCLNVAISQPQMARNRLIEKVKKDKSAVPYFERLIENYGGEHYKMWLDEINVKLAKAIESRMTDWTYYNTFRSLNPIVGKEVALSMMHVVEERHQEIMDDVKYRKRKNQFDETHQTELEEEQVYDIFNSITDAAKGYNGIERVQLQTVGGQLL